MDPNEMKKEPVTPLSGIKPPDKIGIKLSKKQKPGHSHGHLRWLIIIVVIIVGLVVIRQAFFPKGKAVKEDAVAVGAKEERIAITAYKVGRFNFEDSLNALGTIKGSVEFKLSFEIPGVVSAINYREGEKYEEGALLVSLRQDDILLRNVPKRNFRKPEPL